MATPRTLMEMLEADPDLMAAARRLARVQAEILADYAQRQSDAERAATEQETQAS